jgi:hypothetical protein
MHGPIPNHRLRDAIARELLDEREADELLAPAAASLPSSPDDGEEDAADVSDDVDILTGGATTPRNG